MAKVKAIVVGTGGMARHHIRTMLKMKRNTTITGFVEVSEKQRQEVIKLYSEEKEQCPPFYNTIKELLKQQQAPDAAFICTPHKFHYENTCDCLKNGIDVLLEKPMVMNASEARRLIKLRDKTGKLLVVAFPGSLSPAIHKAKELIKKGELGQVTAIVAHVYQGWKQGTTGTWRQDPEISGGGFLFDTGSHMVNTVVDLLGEDVKQVSALLDNRGTPVEINASVSGISKSGVMISLTGAGEAMQCCSDITVIGNKGILQTGIWGGSLQLKKLGSNEPKPVRFAKSQGVWEQFLNVRKGKIKNPCPPEIGLRFAKLMDMIRKSAETGQAVKCR